MGKAEEILQEIKQILKKKKLGSENKLESIKKLVKGKSILTLEWLKLGVLVGLISFLIGFANTLPINKIFIGLWGVTQFIVSFLYIPIQQALKHNTLRIVLKISILVAMCTLFGILGGDVFGRVVYGAQVITLEFLISNFFAFSVLGIIAAAIMGFLCIVLCKMFFGFPGASNENTINRYFIVRGDLKKIEQTLKKILFVLGFYVRGPLRWKNTKYFKCARAGEMIRLDPNKLTIVLNKKSDNQVEVGVTVYRDTWLEPLTTNFTHEFVKLFEHTLKMSFPSLTPVNKFSRFNQLKYLSFREHILTLKPQLGLVMEWSKRHYLGITFVISVLLNLISIILFFFG